MSSGICKFVQINMKHLLYSHTDCLRLTKSLIYLGAELFIHLNVSRAIVLSLPRCSVGRFVLIKSFS